ncbi:MAG: DNA double-strand break repair nuclease NurA [Crenarchaeota archaeon]|nr:DNA double-strand break repair nuclease NurA [Thermoproteota archaeon]
MPDLFFDLYAREFEKDVKERLRSGQDRAHTSLLKILDNVRCDEVWRGLRGLSKRNDYYVVAVDGGIRTISFTDGSEVVIARAIAVNNFGAQPVRTLKTKYLPVPSSAAYWTYLGIAELETCIRAVIEQLASLPENKDKYLLVDGSLYARFTAAVHNLILTRGFLDLYYVPEIMENLYKLCTLLELCGTYGINIVFVSKNSSLKMLKDHIIFTMLKEELKCSSSLNFSSDIYEIFTRGAEWYSIVWLRRYRKKLVELAKEYDGSNREIIREGIRIVISQSITDACVLEYIASRNNISFAISRKLLIGIVDAYMNDKKLVTPDAIYRMIIDRVEDSIMLRMCDDIEAEEYRRFAKKVKEKLEYFPRILLTYVKFRKDDSPILIELTIPKWRLFDDTIPPKIFYDSFNMWDTLEMLYSEYKDPFHYNRMLWLAHNYVTFSDSEFREYEMVAIRSLEGVKGRRIHTLIMGA